MSVLFDILLALILLLLIGVPVVTLLDKAKKEMEADERGDDDVLE